MSRGEQHSGDDGPPPDIAAASPAAGAAAVLFDLDGLLVDSEPVWTIAEEALAVRLGGRWSTELKAQIIGTRLDVSVPMILEWYGAPVDAVTVADTRHFLLARMVELFGAGLPLHRGALGLLDALRNAQVPSALVSSSYRVLVDAALRELGNERFAVTVAGDEVAHGKPHPEPYLTACRLLGADPARCVVLEDAASGVASAEAAGCVVVAVPDVAPIAAAPNRPVVRSLSDIDPQWLLSLPDLAAGEGYALAATMSEGIRGAGGRPPKAGQS